MAIYPADSVPAFASAFCKLLYACLFTHSKQLPCAERSRQREARAPIFLGMNRPEWEALQAFRHEVYARFGCRREALFEALDAVLTASRLETPAHLSLAPSCQRGWGSLYDALNAGSMDLTGLERLVASYPLDPQTTWFTIDARVWPRCDAETSPDRGY
jgi:hypothetical protein